MKATAIRAGCSTHIVEQLPRLRGLAQLGRLLDQMVPYDFALAALGRLHDQGDGLVQLSVLGKLDNLFREEVRVLGDGDFLVELFLLDRIGYS